MKSARQAGRAVALALLLTVTTLVASCGGQPPETRLGVTPLPPQVAGTPPPASDVSEQVRQAQAALDAGNMPEAERLFKDAVARNGGSADAQFGLGNVYFRQGRLPEAETAYRAAIAADPNLTAAHSNLGVVYYQQNQMQKAEDEFNAALKLKPDDGPTLYLLAAVHIQNNKLNDAETLLNQAKTVQPDLAEVYYGLGALYGLQGKKAEAIAAFEKFLSLGTAQDPQAMEEARKQLQELKGQ